MDKQLDRPEATTGQTDHSARIVLRRIEIGDCQPSDPNATEEVVFEGQIAILNSDVLFAVPPPEPPAIDHNPGG